MRINIKSSTQEIITLLTVMVMLASCSKEKNPVDNPDPCLGKSITISAVATPAIACSSNGTITVSASGSSGFSYKISNTGIYRTAGLFESLAPGSYTVFAKDAGGCEQFKTVSVPSSGNTPGPLFAAVKSLMATTCQPCHNNTVQNGGKNWQNDCNIVLYKDRIKVRAVDEGTMPQGGPSLTQEQKDIITNWINAGGIISN